MLEVVIIHDEVAAFVWRTSVFLKDVHLIYVDLLLSTQRSPSKIQTESTLFCRGTTLWDRNNCVGH